MAQAVIPFLSVIIIMASASNDIDSFVVDNIDRVTSVFRLKVLVVECVKNDENPVRTGHVLAARRSQIIESSR